MGVTWTDLHSDEMPAYVVADYIDVMNAEGEAEKRRRREAERKR